MTINLSSKHLIVAALIVAILVAGGFYYFQWHKSQPMTPIVDWAKPEPIKKAVNVKKTVKPMKQVQALDKEEVGAAARLPESITKDPDIEVVATGKAPPHEANTNIVATMNTRTGEGSIQIKQEPLPFFGLPNEVELGIAGYQMADLQGAKPILAGDIAWTPIRIGEFRLQFKGEANSRPEARAGIRGFVRF